MTAAPQVPFPEARRKFISVNEAAERLGVEHKTIRRSIARGDLKAYKVGRTAAIRIDVAELDALLRPIPTTGGGQ
jgi:excisionase family DNA binding protein